MNKINAIDAAMGKREDQNLAEFEEALRSLTDDGLYPARFFSDPTIFELEKDRVFGSAWIFLAHESEIPNKGDYVRRYIVDDQFIVSRGTDGVVRALHNSCRHRGMQVCRSDEGNTSRFTCPYHAWTYGNTGALIGVPMEKDLYGPEFNKADYGLRNIPKLGIYHGLIFGCTDPNGPELDDYLGVMKWYLDMMVARTPAGLEVVGPPQRWVVDANWKFGADNFVGDAYHTFSTHRSMIGQGIDTREATFAVYGQHIQTENGHGLGIGGAPPGSGLAPIFGIPGDVQALAAQTLKPEQFEMMDNRQFIHGTVFPNFSFLQVKEAKDFTSPPVAMLTFRVWQPIGPDKMEIWSWCMVDKEAPDEFKKDSYQVYTRTFGSSGGFEQDDAENWRSINKVIKGRFGIDSNFNYQLGAGVKPLEDWPGPGTAYPIAFAEMNQVAFHKRWLAYMMKTA